MLRFSIRDVLWLTVVVGLAVGWGIARTELSEARTQVSALRDDLKASEEQLELRCTEHHDETNELGAQNHLLEIRLQNAGKRNEPVTVNRD